MRAEPMKWVQRLVGLVFLMGLVALGAAVVSVTYQAEGIPPLPVFLGLLGLVVLLLLTGACMALISLALTAARSADVLQEIAAQGGKAVSPVAPVRPFSSPPFRDLVQKAAVQPAAAGSSLPPRPTGRKLVAER
ncbi:hypothetical protein [Paracoccus seriniphilus]|uniref:Holin-X, holin superfamily III n=1 Tax=Paracoccus seriniphilus TaxID=184748 RepID=A0A239PLQ0_9RHOB|nr:hypothetical protein [Paracoccus seriniphilus]WCR13693.1 hypothetical protein JHW44_12355 [Paracoccus seriniphilus]SNT68706.1 hypothetical protein SAMN05444959_101266 [Paracoccus seriniphilus]